MELRKDELALGDINTFIADWTHMVNSDFTDEELETLENTIETYRDSPLGNVLEGVLNDMENQLEIRKKELGKSR